MLFQPGQSGNPSGRPKAREVELAAREHTIAAINKLAEIMADPAAKHRDQAFAANALLDRGWGKPTQVLEHEGPEGGPVQFVLMGVPTSPDSAAWVAAHRPAG